MADEAPEGGGWVPTDYQIELLHGGMFHAPVEANAETGRTCGKCRYAVDKRGGNVRCQKLLDAIQALQLPKSGREKIASAMPGCRYWERR